MAKATGRKKLAAEPTPPEPRQATAAGRDAAIAALDAKLVELIQQRATLFAEARAWAGTRRSRRRASTPARGRCRSGSSGPSFAKSKAAADRWSARRGSPFWALPTVTATWPPSTASARAAIRPVGTIAAVFEEVHCGHADVGLAPLENSTDGRIADTLEMFTRLPVRICGQVEMAIHHWLLAKCRGRRCGRSTAGRRR